MKPHLFTMPMDSSGACGQCGKSCIDDIHVSVGYLQSGAIANPATAIKQLMADAERYQWLRARVRMYPADSWSEALKLVLPEFYEKEGIKFAKGSMGQHLDFVIDANIQARSDAACEREGEKK